MPIRRRHRDQHVGARLRAQVRGFQHLAPMPQLRQSAGMGPRHARQGRARRVRDPETGWCGGDERAALI